MGVRDEKEWFRDIRDRSYSAVEAEIKDAKAERPFDFGLIACGPKPRPAKPSPV